MTSPRDRLLSIARENTRDLLRLELSTLREMAAEYERARREILAAIQARDMSTDAGRFAASRDFTLLDQIDARLRALGAEIERRLTAMSNSARDLGADVAQAEIQTVFRGLDLIGGGVFGAIDFASVEIGLESALAAFAGENARLAALLKSELRVGLIRGESFPQLTKRLLGKDASLFARGKTSALLGARRNVIAANNAARDSFYQAAGVPGLQKQAIAALDARTTDCCLRVHGQIQPLSSPYELTGTPRFSDKLDYPPFHWHCRSSSVAYHADFEVGARVTTTDMREAARAALRERG